MTETNFSAEIPKPQKWPDIVRPELITSGMSPENVDEFCRLPIQVIFVHGSNVLLKPPYLALAVEMLENMGFEAMGKKMPHSFRGREADWLPWLNKKINSNPLTIIAGHSTGARAARKIGEVRKFIGAVLFGDTDTDIPHIPVQTWLERMSGYSHRESRFDLLLKNLIFTREVRAEHDLLVREEDRENIDKNLGPAEVVKDVWHVSLENKIPELTLQIILEELKKRDIAEQILHLAKAKKMIK